MLGRDHLGNAGSIDMHEMGHRDAPQRMTEIDYAKVNRYWEDATPSILGPYMLDDFGFPASAGDFRFRGQSGH